MSYPGPPAVRGHLRLAGPPGERRRAAENRFLLLGRAAAVGAALVLLTVVAWMLAAVTLIPLAFRRAPLGTRLQPLRSPQARVIPFERARDKALPR